MRKTLINFTYIFLIMIIYSCMSESHIKNNLDIQGHRGCRGLMPENTIEGFIKAAQLGVTTMELDVVMTKDSQIIVSHEPFFNHIISTHPDSINITEQNEKDFNIYLMTLQTAQTFDVGLKDHPKFPLQSKIKCFKPSLSQVIDTLEQYVVISNRPALKYNIEIKYDHRFVGQYFPERPFFCDAVMKIIEDKGIKSQCNVQSFDPDILNYVHQTDSTYILSLLVENKDSFKTNLDKLTFKPQIYSPNYKLIDNHLMQYCKQHHIKVIPWTVNETSDITNVIKMGVDGIISDYPDKVIELYQGLLIKEKQ